MFPTEMGVAIGAVHVVASLRFVDSCTAFGTRFCRGLQLFHSFENIGVAIVRSAGGHYRLAFDTDLDFANCTETAGNHAATIAYRTGAYRRNESVYVYAERFRREFGDDIGFFVAVDDFETVSRIFLDFATFFRPFDEFADTCQFSSLLLHDFADDGLFRRLRREFCAEFLRRIFRREYRATIHAFFFAEPFLTSGTANISTIIALDFHVSRIFLFRFATH